MKHILFGFTLFSCLAFCSCNNEASSGNIWYIELEPEHKIGIYNPTKQQNQIITESEEFISDAGLSPNGKHLAFTTASMNEYFQTWIINSNSTNLRKIEMFSEEPGFVWLNENLLVLATLWDDWADHPKDAYEWKLYDIVAHQLRPIIAKDVWYYREFRNHSAFQQISRYEGTAYLGLGSLHLEGDILKQKPQIELASIQIPKYAGAGRDLSWTTNGQAIAFSGEGSNNNMEIFLATDYGRTVRQLTDFQKNYGLSSGGDTSLSPDGQWIVFWMVLDAPKISGLPEGGQIGLLNVNDKNIKYLMDASWSPQGKIVWSKDSHYATFSNGEIHLINVKTSQVTQLTSDGTNKMIFDWR